MPGPISLPMTPFLPKVLTLHPETGTISECVVKVGLHGISAPANEPSRNFHCVFTLYGSAVPTDDFLALHSKLTAATPAAGKWITKLLAALNQNFTSTSVTYKDICRPQASAVTYSFKGPGLVATAALPNNTVATLKFATPFTPGGKARIEVGPLSQADAVGNALVSGSITALNGIFDTTGAPGIQMTDGTNSWQLVISTSGGNLPANPLLPARPQWTNAVKKSQQRLRFNYQTPGWQSPVGGAEIVILEPVTSVAVNPILSSRNSRQSRGRKVSRHQVPDNIARAYKVARVVEDQRLQNLSANMSTEEYLRMLLRNEGQQGGIRGGQRLLEMTPE